MVCTSFARGFEGVVVVMVAFDNCSTFVEQDDGHCAVVVQSLVRLPINSLIQQLTHSITQSVSCTPINSLITHLTHSLNQSINVIISWFIHCSVVVVRRSSSIVRSSFVRRRVGTVAR